jgi:hypothetical protein
LWADLGPEGSVAMNADGTLDDGTPYFEIDAGDGVLEPGETSVTRTFAVKTPTATQYSFTTIVTAVLPPGADPLENMSSQDATSTAAPTVYPYHNYDDPYDVNGNGILEPLDVLIVVNHLNIHGPGPLPEPVESPQVFPDVNADGAVTALDALILVNTLNTALLSGAEGEAASPHVAADLRDADLHIPATLSAPVPEPAALPLRPQDARDTAADRLLWTAPADDSTLLDDLLRRPVSNPSLSADRYFEDLDAALGLDTDDLLDDLAEDLARAATHR